MSVEAYYDSVREAYRAAWGDSFHFAVFRGGESRAEATAATERLIADEGGFKAGSEVLDVGCGVGGPALAIAQYSGARVTGIDLVRGNVDTARDLAETRGLADRVRFEQADAMSLPFEDDSFDHVYVFESGCHAPDKYRYYSECARVLRPGGSILGFEWLRGEELSNDEDLEMVEAICAHFAVPFMLTLSQLREHLLAAGLEPEVVTPSASLGDVSPNWGPLDASALTRVHKLDLGAGDPALASLTLGGAALARASATGAFLVGYFKAFKPE